MSKKTTSKKGLRIIIVGCGKVGITLTEQLAKEGHDITLIDKNAQKLQATAFRRRQESHPPISLSQ